jgi:molybdate transport system substrate-binding protein
MRRSSLLLVVLWAAAACRGQAPPAPLTVFAASSLAAPLEELGALHELRGRQPVRVHLGASGTLARQLREGAPADVLISADEHLLDALVAEGLIDPSSRVVVATNHLVLVVSSGVATPPSAAALLGDERARIGIGDPDVAPVGRYAREWLTRLGAWERLVAARRLVLGPSAQAVLAQVKAGATDAAVVFRSDAATTRDVAILAEAPPEATSPIRYVAGVVRASPHRQAGTVFLDVLAGPEGQRVLADAGFSMQAPRAP